MHRFVTSVLGLLLATGIAWATPSMKSTNNAKRMDWNDHLNVPANPITWHPQHHSELNEIIGDTVIVGSSFWDAQHNGQVGRMIGFAPGDGSAEHPSTVYMVWTKLPAADQSSSRHVYYARIEDGVLTSDPGGATVDLSFRAGYTTLPYRSEDATEIPVFHYMQTAASPAISSIAVRNPFLPTLYNVTGFPVYSGTENDMIWPRGVYGSDGYVHVTSTEARSGNTDPMKITYMRYMYDPETGGVTPATPNEQQVLITSQGMNISSDIHVSDDGANVAITQTLPRELTIGEVFGDGPTQINNDIYLWESTDGGETWDVDNPVNITNFIPPDESYLPNDTTAANQDTMRAYTDGTILYDHDGNLHLAFSAMFIDMIRAGAYVTNRLYHWDRNSGNFTLISSVLSGEFIGRAESWGLSVDRPSLFSDPQSGFLWCVFRKVSVYPDTFDLVLQDDGYYHANSDIYVTASPAGEKNGLLWAKPVNITNTIWPGPDMVPVGESRDEIDPSIALNNMGDSLHIQYLIDLDPGTSITDPPEGQMTDNPIVYHAVDKNDLVSIFNENAEWVQNYPMHCDSTGFWQDPDEYAWVDFPILDYSLDAVDERGTRLRPDQFELEQNYPNPFNATTRIAFQLKHPGLVKLAVYDILGREVAVLLHRNMLAGRHELSFLGEDLPSGVYFYKLSSGESSKIHKMVLMK